MGYTGIVDPDELTLNDPHSGDFQQGSGVSTAQISNVNVGPSEDHPANLRGSIFTQSPAVLLTLIAILIIVKMVAENAGQKSEFSSVRVGLENWFVVTLLAVTGIYVFKTSVALIPSSARWAMALRQFAGLS